MLTHLLGQSLQGLADKIVIYRNAWEAAGHPGRGVVTLMLHTFVGEDDDKAHELVREPMKKYLAGSLNLAAAHLNSVPFLKNPDNINTELLTPELADQTLEASFEKYFHMRSLFGSYEKCLDTVEALEDIDVDEIACLLDYGVDEKLVLASLERLNVLRILANPGSLL